jgi:hypothetical protein
MTQREKVKLPLNVPFVCTLETVQGKPVRSQVDGATDYLYNAQVAGVPAMFFLPVEGAQALQNLRLQPGEEISILKRKVNGDAPTFQIRRMGDGTLAVPAPPPPTPQPIRMLAPRTQAEDSETPRLASADHAVPGTGALVAQCFMCAVDALLGTQIYAAKKGLTLAFNEEDVRALGITIYIGKQKERGY